jgi:nucleoside 2-deoxyribosyltransferase
MDKKKVVYIAGPIAGVENYWEPFEQAEDDLSALGYIPLSPARLPQGMTNEQYMRICFAMIDSADAVLFLPNYESSTGAMLEANYCVYINKPAIVSQDRAPDHLEKPPREVVQAWLKHDLEEVLKI